MKTATILFVVLAFTACETQAQCSRGRQGGGRSQGLGQPASFAQAGFNPLTFQQAALQRQLQMGSFQQQFAMQRMRVQQQLARQQVNQARQARRRSGAASRREAELARREQTRTQNLTRLAAQRARQPDRTAPTQLVSR